ncbi:uncharacterized protein BYT42DRAFT_585664, partial [Radiomyces spectabilis]|uniref:uncharacterized protein n=1 Tax=Radiomyces spectabilis TaxID=64574 RepID=UPI0022203B81
MWPIRFLSSNGIVGGVTLFFIGNAYMSSSAWLHLEYFPWYRVRFSSRPFYFV